MKELALTEKYSMSSDQLQLVRDVVAKGATDDELELFLYRCKAMGLNPLKPGQIHFVKYGTAPGTIVVGIEGFRAMAQRTGQLEGIKRGVIRNSSGQCIGGWAEVYRKGWKVPAKEEVSLAEYHTGKNPWNRMPETMIKKVSEAASLRMAFPDELGGVYTQEEMNHVPAIREEGYIIPDGSLAGMALKAVPRDRLLKFIENGENTFKSNPEKEPMWWQDFLNEAQEHLKSTALEAAS